MTQYRTDGATYDTDSQTYDAHYLAGNYYSYVAATAGTGTSVTSRGDKATDSICPKGFELPTSYSTYDSTPGSFYYLLKQYDLIYTASSLGMYEAPLHFVSSGYISPTNYLSNAGGNGYYWSSVAYSSSYAYNLAFGAGDRADPSSHSSRTLGRSVRCVAPSV